jgi:hypothetical protein
MIENKQTQKLKQKQNAGVLPHSTFAQGQNDTGFYGVGR